MSRGFGLAGLKRLRDLREAGAAGRLAAANAELAQGRQRTQRVREESLASDEQVATGADLLAFAAARASNRSMLTELQTQLAILQTQAEKAEAEHRMARRDAVVVEKLEQRHTQAAARAELTAEQARLDEAAQRGHQGRRRA
ncbi:flagellar FliJ family protein [Nesterenkonia lutea]|uniref:Flagellar FliJ protein n=1 Tax=Nesterenkonia lutea TaxID=272919 RepID=A0ABR9JFD0_9MICC|nr:flagellar FliJ family protein [Nesterenkonia lutea]MBE1524639.1 flagellar FliJ protein [Nesterenkonia lutea]